MTRYHELEKTPKRKRFSYREEASKGVSIERESGSWSRLKQKKKRR